MFEGGGYGDALSIEVSGSVVKLYCGKPHHLPQSMQCVWGSATLHAIIKHSLNTSREREKSSSTVPLPTFTVAFKDDVALGFTF